MTHNTPPTPQPVTPTPDPAPSGGPLWAYIVNTLSQPNLAGDRVVSLSLALATLERERGQS